VTEPGLVDRFDDAMVEIYHAAKRETGYVATRYLVMVREHGGLETARRLLEPGRIHDGFAELLVRGRKDLTVERLVLRPEFRELFTEEELREARDRLGE
jgi:hypothetical protein